MTKFCVEGIVIEKLREQDVSIDNLLREYIKRHTKPKIVGKEAWELLDETNIKDIKAMKEMIAGNYSDKRIQSAINTLQALEETRKEIDEHKNHVSY